MCMHKVRVSIKLCIDFCYFQIRKFDWETSLLEND